MVKLTKIYTRGGDKGETTLGDGNRIPKHDLRVAAYGTVDEANATIGLARLHTINEADQMLSRIQNDLFDLGADLCSTNEKKKTIFIDEKRTKFLENELDKINEKLPPLKSFVIPGGTKSSAFLHNARTVARRCERSILALKEKENINKEAIKYINRLSDFLFVAGRIENIKDGDILWVPNKILDRE